MGCRGTRLCRTRALFYTTVSGCANAFLTSRAAEQGIKFVATCDESTVVYIDTATHLGPADWVKRAHRHEVIGYVERGWPFLGCQLCSAGGRCWFVGRGHYYCDFLLQVLFGPTANITQHKWPPEDGKACTGPPPKEASGWLLDEQAGQLGEESNTTLVGGHLTFQGVTFSPSQKRSAAELLGRHLLILAFTYEFHYLRKRTHIPGTLF